jgi:FK506-binding nuclear protein
MPKKGIKVLVDVTGEGPELRIGNVVRVTCDIQLSRGDFVVQNQKSIWKVGDREMIAGFRYGIEGMRIGGKRVFRAAPHLCYGDKAVAGIPANAVLVFTIKKLELDAACT